MDKTPFSKRVEILGDFYAAVQGNADILSHEFLQDNAETLWICLASNVNYVTVNNDYAWFVNDTWDSFCEYLGVDNYGWYESFNEMWEFAHEQG